MKTPRANVQTPDDLFIEQLIGMKSAAVNQDNGDKISLSIYLEREREREERLPPS